MIETVLCLQSDQQKRWLSAHFMGYTEYSHAVVQHIIYYTVCTSEHMQAFNLQGVLMLGYMQTIN